MIKGLGHIGICVNHIDEVLYQWKKAFEIEIVKEKSEYPGMKYCMVSLGGILIEIMEPNGEGVIKRHLEKHGEGFHHLCLQVDDFEIECPRMEAAGMSLINDFCGNFFITPKSNHGILCEVVNSVFSK